MKIKMNWLTATLQLYDVNGARRASNDDWKDTQQNATAATGLAPPNDFESAIVGTLSPGNYTAIVRGFNNTSGNRSGRGLRAGLNAYCCGGC